MIRLNNQQEPVSVPREKLAVGRYEAAELSSLSVRSVDALIASGELDACRVGRRVLIPVASLNAMLRRHSIKPRPEVRRGN